MVVMSAPKVVSSHRAPDHFFFTCQSEKENPSQGITLTVVNYIGQAQWMQKVSLQEIPPPIIIKFRSFSPR